MQMMHSLFQSLGDFVKIVSPPRKGPRSWARKPMPSSSDSGPFQGGLQVPLGVDRRQGVSTIRGLNMDPKILGLLLEGLPKRGPEFFWKQPYDRTGILEPRQERLRVEFKGFGVPFGISSLGKGSLPRAMGIMCRKPIGPIWDYSGLLGFLGLLGLLCLGSFGRVEKRC